MSAHTETEVTMLPVCDFCGAGKRASYDGKTTLGPWASMCDEHFKTYGIGLGRGKGQRLILVTTNEREAS